MRPLTTLLPIALLATLAWVLPAGAAPAKTTLAGETDQGRSAKLVADSRGRVIRGAFTVETDCSGRFKPFRARVELRKPLDRSTQDGFRDRGSTLEKDGEFSARYRHEIEGDHTGRRKIKGAIDLEIVFRRNGDPYVTCEADDVGFITRKRGSRRASA